MFTEEERFAFRRALRFLWTVRCHLHFITGRGEERLTFDLQPEMAKRMGYSARGDQSAVERFMKRYFLVAKEVGMLTRVLCARLEADHAKNAPRGLQRFFAARAASKPRRRAGLFHRWRAAQHRDRRTCSRRPRNVIALFEIAERRDLDMHPDALGEAARRARAADAGVAQGRRGARELFLKIVASRAPSGARR